jgi:integrase
MGKCRLSKKAIDAKTKRNTYFFEIIRTTGTDRTLYSLRHTYATQELLAGTDIHTLARQMVTSVTMLERHYSKLTATMAAEQLA